MKRKIYLKENRKLDLVIYFDIEQILVVSNSSQ